MTTAERSPLGKQSSYQSSYYPDLLFAIPRRQQRERSGITEPLPFQGVDIWNAYELSWLNAKGKPQVMLAAFELPCNSPCLVESKSFKLYLNSFNQSRFPDSRAVTEALSQDLSKVADAQVKVTLFPLNSTTLQNLEGKNLDDLDISCDTYDLSPDLLKLDTLHIEETVTTDLFRSNCLITNQPDWASIAISYKGPKINHESLLRYLVSFRNHQGFHEDCTERVFVDLLTRCHPEELTVNARFTRRGGLDINCLRSTSHISTHNQRTPRQ